MIKKSLKTNKIFNKIIKFNKLTKFNKLIKFNKKIIKKIKTKLQFRSKNFGDKTSENFGDNVINI